MSQTPRTFRLVLRKGPTVGREFPLERETITIGRQEGNDIVIDDSRVSRQHARLISHGSSYMLEDLGSGNGTWINEARISTPVMLQSGDMIGLSPEVLLAFEGSTPLAERTFLLPRRQPEKSGGDHKSVWAFGVGGLVVLVAVIVVAILGLAICLLSGALAPGSLSATPTVLAAYPTSTPYPTHTPSPETISENQNPPPVPEERLGTESIELARRATVLVVALIDEEDGYTGSGGIVDSRGYILTNYHVIEGTVLQYVGLNGPREDEPPEVYYEVEVVTVDEALDLALLHIVADEDGNALKEELNLPTLTVGNSDKIGLGETLIILGFPGLGQETVTLTKGTVAGFIDDELVGLDRGWIKTDAEINHGNSGGVAINRGGELIGVPTIIFVSEEETGKIGQLRPINLAQEILDQIPE